MFKQLVHNAWEKKKAVKTIKIKLISLTDKGAKLFFGASFTNCNKYKLFSFKY